MDELQQPSLRVILVEDSPLLCEMLSEMLDELDGVDVVAHAAGEQEALEALE
jgi:CheY-like chemotaxis protein